MTEQSYLNLLQRVLNEGSKKSIFSPTGTLGTIDKNKYSEIDKDSKYLLSVFGASLNFDCTNGIIPIYTSKSVYYPGAFKEMLWFFTGEGDVALLHRQKCPVWDGFAYKHYMNKHNKKSSDFSYDEFVETHLNNGNYIIPVPYTDFTSFKSNGKSINQTKWAIDTIQKTPDRKSFVVSAWNPSRLYGMSTEESVVLAACHCEHQLVVNDGFLNLRVTIRSNDLILGNPFNVAGYGLLLHMYAFCTGFKPGQLLVQITDAHIYSDQIGPELTKQINSTNHLKPFPTIEIKQRGQKYLEDFKFSDFNIKDYFPEESLRYPLTLVGGF